MEKKYYQPTILHYKSKTLLPLSLQEDLLSSKQKTIYSTTIFYLLRFTILTLNHFTSLSLELKESFFYYSTTNLPFKSMEQRFNKLQQNYSKSIIPIRIINPYQPQMTSPESHSNQKNDLFIIPHQSYTQINGATI